MAEPYLAEELLPCPSPWCTKSEPELHQGGFRNGHFRVECQNCFTKGPTRSDLNGGGPAAITVWNTRSPAPTDRMGEELAGELVKRTKEHVEKYDVGGNDPRRRYTVAQLETAMRFILTALRDKAVLG